MQKAICKIAQRKAPDSLERETGTTKVVVVNPSNNPKEGLNFKDKAQIALAIAGTIKFLIEILHQIIFW